MVQSETGRVSYQGGAWDVNSVSEYVEDAIEEMSNQPGVIDRISVLEFFLTNNNVFKTFSKSEVPQRNLKFTE